MQPVVNLDVSCSFDNSAIKTLEVRNWFGFLQTNVIGANQEERGGSGGKTEGRGGVDEEVRRRRKSGGAKQRQLLQKKKKKGQQRHVASAREKIKNRRKELEKVCHALSWGRKCPRGAVASSLTHLRSERWKTSTCASCTVQHTSPCSLEVCLKVISLLQTDSSGLKLGCNPGKPLWTSCHLSLPLVLSSYPFKHYFLFPSSPKIGSEFFFSSKFTSTRVLYFYLPVPSFAIFSLFLFFCLSLKGTVNTRWESLCNVERAFAEESEIFNSYRHLDQRRCDATLRIQLGKEVLYLF